MAKRRRTRAQKERTARNRQQKTIKYTQPGTDNVESDKHKVFTEKNVDQNTTVMTKNQLWNPQQKQGIRLSLTLLAILLLCQLAIWIVFSATEIDSGLYELINV